MTQKGKFIVLEGIDGCGKDTQHEKLSTKLYRDNKSMIILSTREPNELDQYGKDTRYMLKTDENPTQNALRDLRGYCMNRDTHNQVFNPLLKIGIYVISNRYWHSTFAYQHAQGLDYKTIANLNFGFSVPDLTLIIDTSLEESWKRIGYDERRNRERFERKEFLERVRQNYLELPSILPDLMHDRSIRIVDGMGTEQEVWERIYEIVKNENILPPKTDKKNL